MKEVKYSVAMFDNSPLPFCVIRVELDENAAPVDWTFLYCNDALAELEGYPKEKLLGKRFFHLFPDGDRKWLKPYYEAAYEKRAAAFDSVSEEIGQYLHIDCIPLDEPGLCACLLRNTKQENEYRQRLENEISAANNLHAAITTGTWRIEYNAEGERTCLWSDSFRRLLGYYSEKDLPDTWNAWFDLIHPDDREAVFDRYDSAVWDRSGKESYDVEYRMRNRQGEYHWFRDVAHFTRTSDGAPLYADGIISLNDYKHRMDEELRAALRETEETNRALQANTEFLRRTERYNRTLLDRASCGIVSYTLPERKNLYMNAEAMRVYGIDSMEEAHMYLHELMEESHYNSPVTLRRLKALRKHDGMVDFECVINNRKGHTTSIVVHTEVVTSPQGERVAYTTFMDSSENRSLKNEKEILNALCKDYVTVIQCDLQADIAVRLNIDQGRVSPRAEKLYQMLPEDNSYSSIFAAYFDMFVDPEVSADFHEKTDAGFLMDYLPKHNDRFSYRYQLKPNSSGVKHMEMQVSHFNSAEGFQVVAGFRVIDGIILEEEQEKEKLQAINNTLQEQNDIITGLAREYCNVWLVTNDGECCAMYQDGSLDNDAQESAGFAEMARSYAKGMRYYCNKLVGASAQQDFLQKTEYEEVLSQIRKQPVYTVTYPRRCSDNKEEYYQISFTQTGYAGSNDFIVAFKNVDEVVQAERRKNEVLSDALIAAEHANRAKTQFLNSMSHDIRTPMNAIIGFTSLAGTHLDNKELVREYLRKISTSSEHLLSLINDVLDMSRIESGKVKIEEKPFHLPDLLHDIRTIIQPTITSKQLDLFIDTVDVIDEDVTADKLRLTQVLLNILGNGVKFNKTGGMLSLRVRQESKAPKGYACYHFIIRDTGIGISKEFQKHIFESFSREESSTVSGIQGTGLGLAITKRIVDMMGGTISVKSEEGEGSEFDVCLTLKLSGEKKVYERIEALQGLRVLVADDDTDTCLSVAKMLKEIGMRSEWTVSGKEAVIRAKNAMELGDEFYAYIIDWLMPDMNGIETVRRIRRVIGDAHPIIILTAYDWSDIEEEAREAGVTAFCEKPLFMSELRGILTQPYQMQPPKEEKRDPGRFCGKTILLVEDNELNQEIAVTLLNEAGFATDVAQNGAVAVEKMRNSMPGQYDLILMDVQMPVMDGYTATRMIRSLAISHCHKIPIIAMTANAFVEDQERAIEAGMNGYQAKPIQISELLKTIETVL